MQVIQALRLSVAQLLVKTNRFINISARDIAIRGIDTDVTRIYSSAVNKGLQRSC